MWLKNSIIKIIMIAQGHAHVHPGESQQAGAYERCVAA